MCGMSMVLLKDLMIPENDEDKDKDIILTNP